MHLVDEIINFKQKCQIFESQLRPIKQILNTRPGPALHARDKLYSQEDYLVECLFHSVYTIHTQLRTQISQLLTLEYDFFFFLKDFGV